jgi:hypothetical protein
MPSLAQPGGCPHAVYDMSYLVVLRHDSRHVALLRKHFHQRIDIDIKPCDLAGLRLRKTSGRQGKVEVSILRAIVDCPPLPPNTHTHTHTHTHTYIYTHTHTHTYTHTHARRYGTFAGREASNFPGVTRREGIPNVVVIGPQGEEHVFEKGEGSVAITTKGAAAFDDWAKFKWPGQPAALPLSHL